MTFYKGKAFDSSLLSACFICLCRPLSGSSIAVCQHQNAPNCCDKGLLRMTSCSPGQPFSRSWYSTMSTNSKYWFFGLCGWGAKGTQRSILCQYIRCSHLKLSNYLSEAKDVISGLLWVQIDNQSLEKLTCFSCFPFSTALLSTFFPSIFGHINAPGIVGRVEPGS